MEGNEHAYIVFGKNINSSKHVRTEGNIAENKICSRDEFSFGVRVIFFFFPFLMLGEGQLTEDKREIVGD